MIVILQIFKVNCILRAGQGRRAVYPRLSWTFQEKLTGMELTIPPSYGLVVRLCIQ